MLRPEAVHVIDDDAPLRMALENLFRSVGLTTKTYANTLEFLDGQQNEATGCLVLDIRMPGMSGLDFQKKMGDLGLYLPIVFLTGHGDIRMTVRGMKGGAVDFLTKPFDDQDMLDAVENALQIDRARRAIESSTSDLRMRFDSLSKREKEVMKAVATGKMNKQVAGDLGLSEVTIKIHRRNAMRKMGARSLAELVNMATSLNGENTNGNQLLRK